MKNLIKVFALVAFCLTTATHSFAQQKSETDALKGIWRLASFAKEGEEANSNIHAFKIFDGNGNFSVLNTPNVQTSIITHQGKYEILSATEYAETVTDGAFKTDGKPNKLQYKIEDDGNKILLKFQVGSDTYNEIWDKVEIAPSPL